MTRVQTVAIERRAPQLELRKITVGDKGGLTVDLDQVLKVKQAVG
jgi:hypothetical protein